MFQTAGARAVSRWSTHRGRAGCDQYHAGNARIRVQGREVRGRADASGGIPPYNFKVTAGALPPGLGLGSGGVLSGKPITRGTYSFAITAADKYAFTGTRSYTLTVA